MTDFRRRIEPLDTYSAVSARGLSPHSLFKLHNRYTLPWSHKNFFSIIHEKMGNVKETIKFMM